FRVWTISAAWMINSPIITISTATMGNSATAAPLSARSLRSRWRRPPGRCFGRRRAVYSAPDARGPSLMLLMRMTLEVLVGSEAAAEERRHRILEDLHDLV